jgi:hypothetical protein
VKRTKRSSGILAFLVVALAAPTVRAEAAESDEATAGAARELAVEGRSAYAAGDYARAQELFHRAHEMVGAPTLAVYEARSLARLGRLLDAIAVYRGILGKPVDPSAPEQFHRALADAGRELADLESRVPTLLIRFKEGTPEDTSARVSLDGAAIDQAMLGKPTPVDPGSHRVELVAGGRAPQVQTIDLTEGVHHTVELGVEQEATRPAPMPVAAVQSDKPVAVHPSGHDPTMRTLAYVSLGLGVAGIGTGVVTGILAAGKHSDAEKGCPDNRCEPGSQGMKDVDAFRTLRTVSTVGYVVGAAAAIGGVTLFVLSPSRDERPSAGMLEIWASPGRAGVRGRF